MAPYTAIATLEVSRFDTFHMAGEFAPGTPNQPLPEKGPAQISFGGMVSLKGLTDDRI